jgi:hypothetical protein
MQSLKSPQVVGLFALRFLILCTYSAHVGIIVCKLQNKNDIPGLDRPIEMAVGSHLSSFHKLDRWKMGYLVYGLAASQIHSSLLIPSVI